MLRNAPSTDEAGPEFFYAVTVPTAGLLTATVEDDTGVDADGATQLGTYTLTMDFLPLTGTACAMDPVDLRMYWSACAEGIDCYRAEEDGSTYSDLRTPPSVRW